MTATTDKPNVADLLGAATKKKGTTNHLTYSEPGVLALAERWLSMSAQQDEAEREKKLLADQILASVSRWHRETCQKRHSFDGTVVLPAASGAVAHLVSEPLRQDSAGPGERIAGGAARGL